MINLQIIIQNNSISYNDLSHRGALIVILKEYLKTYTIDGLERLLSAEFDLKVDIQEQDEIER